MLQETEIEIQFRDWVVVSPSSTSARLEANFTENVSAIIKAQKSFRDTYGPSSLEFHKEERRVNTPDGIMEYPILVWDARWDHGRVSKIPSFVINYNDSLLPYPINEDDFEDFIAL